MITIGLGRNFHHTNYDTFIPANVGSVIVAMHPFMYLHSNSRDSGDGGSGKSSSGRSTAGGGQFIQFLRRLLSRHESYICIRWPFYVFHYDLRDEKTCWRQEVSVCAARICNCVSDSTNISARPTYVLTMPSSFYVIFGVVMYVYLGPNVASPAFSSLPSKWAKIAVCSPRPSDFS